MPVKDRVQRAPRVHERERTRQINPRQTTFLPQNMLRIGAQACLDRQRRIGWVMIWVPAVSIHPLLTRLLMDMIELHSSQDQADSIPVMRPEMVRRVRMKVLHDLNEARTPIPVST